MGGSRANSSLTVIMQNLAEQRWSCHSCGNCCRSLTGHLTEEDRKRIDDFDWRAELGVAPYVPLGRGHVLNKTVDDVCVFLDEQNRCRIHSRFGEAAKPVACRIFPFSVRRITRGWQGSLRFDCPSVVENKGKAIGEHHDWLTELIREMPNEAVEDSTVDLVPGLKATSEEVNMLLSRLRAWLDGHGAASGLSFPERILGAAHMTTLLSAAKFDKVRGERFEELLDIVLSALPDELGIEREPATSAHRGMLRQLVLAHTEHVSVEEARAGFWGRSKKKWKQLVVARRMRRGSGRVPKLRGVDLTGAPTFSEVEAVEPARDDAARAHELMRRYVTARIEGLTVFGAGYYGWPVFSGLSALWLALAAVGWIARCHAGGHGRSELTLGDIGVALGVVDRAATRLPSAGSLVERLRAAYLLRDDGACRLLEAYRWA